MRNTILLIFITVFQAYATDIYSQNTRLSLDLNKVPVAKVLEEIEDNSEFYFLLNAKLIDVKREVSISTKDEKISEILTSLFSGTGVRYLVYDRQIILTPGDVTVISDAIQQQQKVTGTVTDKNGAPLPGVNIVVTGTTQGTLTDVAGKFSIEIPKGSKSLTFSFVGMEPQEITIGTLTQINVTMAESAIGLEEVVVIGYGTVKKSDLTGSVSQVKSDIIKSIPTPSVLQALSGRSAGVQVLQNTGAPGANVSVRIRGANSIQGSNEPLYVVDGFPLAGSNPSVLNNSDIESIEILKDASSTAIYGSRGANGVVLITTKQGKLGKTLVDVDLSYSMQSLRKKLEVCNAQEYAQFINQTRASDGLAVYFTQDQIDKFGKGTDWQDLIYKKAPMKTGSFTLSSGTEKTQFSLSGSTTLQEGIIGRSKYNRNSIHFNINHNISKQLSVTISSTLSAINIDESYTTGGDRGSSLIQSPLVTPPTLTPYNDDGTYRNMLTAYPFISNALSNGVATMNELLNNTKDNRILTNAALIYKPIPELTIKVSGGIENSDAVNNYYYGLKIPLSKGSASMGSRQYKSLLSENTISYSKTFDKHNLSAVAGFTYQDFLGTSIGGSGSGFISDATQNFDLSSAQTPGLPTSSYTKSVLLSFLGRVNYSFDNKYLFTISIRQDGSSKYSEGDKWSTFPSAALAWKIKNENFLKDNNFISDLKIRASWGFTGSQAIDAYATLNQLYTSKTTFDKASFNAVAPGTRLPENLKWETTEQKDVGLDLGILENRFVITADYYIKNTSNLLNVVTLPYSSGYLNTIRNVGSMQNKGFELGLDGRILTGDFKWDLNGNISFNRNKITELYGGIDILGAISGPNYAQDYTNILRVGRPVGQFYGYVEDGYDATGKFKYKDLDNDGSITAKDKTYIGDPNPNFIYGLNSSMSYKNFNLTVYIQGSQGNDLLNISQLSSILDYGIGLNVLKEVYQNHWTPENLNAKYPIPSVNTSSKMSSRFVEDGSYLRFKNIQLAYNLPVDKLGVKWMRSLQVYVSGQNLITLTNYSWFDPEVNSLGGPNSTAQGQDYMAYPISKSYTFGIRAGF